MEKRNLEPFKGPHSGLADETLQRALWLSDFLQIESFERKCILEMIMTHISIKNCVMFLNEAFKKLNVSEESSEIWYTLLNFCVSFVSKNLEPVWKLHAEKLVKIGPKIIEEIIERALRIARSEEGGNYIEIVKILLEFRKENDPISLLGDIRKAVVRKTENSTNF
jgi:hypothetical protein